MAPSFRNINEPLVLICIDESRLTSEIKYEDNDNCGRYYPHIYGEVNMSSVVRVLPFLKDNNGDYIKNPEFENIMNA